MDVIDYPCHRLNDGLAPLAKEGGPRDLVTKRELQRSIGLWGVDDWLHIHKLLVVITGTCANFNGVLIQTVYGRNYLTKTQSK